MARVTIALLIALAFVGWWLFPRPAPISYVTISCGGEIVVDQAHPHCIVSCSDESGSVWPARKDGSCYVSDRCREHHFGAPWCVHDFAKDRE